MLVREDLTLDQLEFLKVENYTKFPSDCILGWISFLSFCLLIFRVPWFLQHFRNGTLPWEQITSPKLPINHALPSWISRSASPLLCGTYQSSFDLPWAVSSFHCMLASIPWSKGHLLSPNVFFSYLGALFLTLRKILPFSCSKRLAGQDFCFRCYPLLSVYS